MPVMSFEECRPYLEPLVERAIPALHQSHELVQAILNDRPQLHSILDGSTQASMLSNIFADVVSPRFAEAGVAWQKTGRMQHGMIGGVINLRFKKLTTDLHSMNVPTEQQMRLYHQWTLPNHQDVTQVTLGYLNDPITRAIAGIFYICPRGWRSNHWSWCLSEADGQQLLFNGSPSPTEPTVYDPDLDVTVSANQSDVESA